MSNKMYVLTKDVDNGDGIDTGVIAVSSEIDNLKARAQVALEEYDSFEELEMCDWQDVHGDLVAKIKFRSNQGDFAGDMLPDVFRIQEVEEV